MVILWETEGPEFVFLGNTGSFRNTLCLAMSVPGFSAAGKARIAVLRSYTTRSRLESGLLRVQNLDSRSTPL